MPAKAGTQAFYGQAPRPSGKNLDPRFRGDERGKNQAPYASSRMRFLRKLGFSTALRRRIDFGVTSTSSSSAI